MKNSAFKVLTGISIVTATFGIIVASWNTASAQGSQFLCGPGVIVRSNNTVMIDRWTSPDVLTSPLMRGEPKFHTGPSRIVVSDAIDGSVPICIETTTGMSCMTLIAFKAAVGKK